MAPPVFFRAFREYRAKKCLFWQPKGCAPMPLPGRKKDRKYTYQDYLTWPDQERWEIIDGEAWAMTPAPTVAHQRLLRNTVRLLASFFKDHPCELFLAPTDVVLAADNVVQPDLFVVCDSAKVTAANIQGAPDLIVEIASPSTKLLDKRDKKSLYEKFGVREYLIFYPDDALVERFFMENGKFGGPDVFNWDETWTSFVFPDLEIPLWEIFEKPGPESGK
jgi:Uma2 family endonuclease